MLQMRNKCEHCHKVLIHENEETYICSYECTYCKECVETVLKNTCPNCGGNFEKRPLRFTK